VPTSRPPVNRRSQSPRALRKRESIQRLQDALAEDRLTVQYQPIVDAHTARPVAAEALLRWRHPKRETYDIKVLLAAAERSPVIYSLERWVVETCCTSAAAWQRGPLRDLRLNVNLSAREFDRARFPDRLRSSLHKSGIDSGRVTLEITETSGISDPAAVAEVLTELKRDGFEVWLDDFGTGHSSLEWLFRLPADGVKIPSTFVDDVTRDDRAATITAAVIELAHRLGLRVVAEGVEHQEQRHWLAQAGCEQLQGFLFHAAMAAPVLARRLAER
jgi:EAL domain-containing protein (putative c-di-GMP-specific phosphodiesterase class I)